MRRAVYEVGEPEDHRMGCPPGCAAGLTVHLDTPLARAWMDMSAESFSQTWGHLGSILCI